MDTQSIRQNEACSLLNFLQAEYRARLLGRLFAAILIVSLAEVLYLHIPGRLPGGSIGRVSLVAIVLLAAHWIVVRAAWLVIARYPQESPGHDGPGLLGYFLIGRPRQPEVIRRLATEVEASRSVGLPRMLGRVPAIADGQSNSFMIYPLSGSSASIIIVCFFCFLSLQKYGTRRPKNGMSRLSLWQLSFSWQMCPQLSRRL